MLHLWRFMVHLKEGPVPLTIIPPNPPPWKRYPGPNIPYAYPHLHQNISGLVVAPPVYPNFAPSHYYHYALTNAPSPSTIVAQPPMISPPLPQHAPPPQGQLYAQQSGPNPPNPEKRNKEKVNRNQQSQGNQGNQGPPPNAPQDPQPNPAT